MKEVNITKEKYGKYGNVIKLSNGVIELMVTIDLGPRIIRLAPCGKENIFFEDVNDEFDRRTKDMEIFGDVWHIYGGHRLWSSPEISPRTYYPDNQPVEYTILKNGVRVVPQEQKWTNLQLMMDIVFKGDRKIEVKHRIVNKGAWDIELAPWGLTVMRAGGVEVVPFPKRNPELLPNRNLGVWPYTNLQDKRITLGKDYLMLRQDEKVRGKVKLGLNNEEGCAMYFIDGNLFVMSYESVVEGDYPDGGMSYETFTRANMLEMETLGEYALLHPNEGVDHVETWQLFEGIELPDSEKGITELMAKKLKK